jgi:von Willebrand factor A domain-containing protein 7
MSWAPRLLGGLVVCGAVVLCVSRAPAFTTGDAGHVGITKEGLEPIAVHVGGAVVRFSAAAIRQIQTANRNTDVYEFFGVPQHFDDEDFTGATQRLVTLREQVIAALGGVSPQGKVARRDLGTALHTVQDFYSHSNWVELEHTTIDARLGREVFAGLGDEPTCPDEAGRLGGVALHEPTTGYWLYPNPCRPTSGKCRHGIGGLCESGLNKDRDSRPRYAVARRLAVTATTDFVMLIVNDPRIAGNVRAVRALMSGA